ncbi:MAG: phosphatidylglycerol lysyltransferase domain-containing protein [Thermodesulfobacteriota bacterium]
MADQALDRLNAAGWIPLGISDKDRINGLLGRDGSETSEMNFTNLFMWRHHYRPMWREYRNSLIVFCAPEAEVPFALPPAGPGDQAQAVAYIFRTMKELDLVPRIHRAGRSLIQDLNEKIETKIEPDPDQDDYVYLTADLISLSGRRLHQKKNHLNHFLKNYSFEVKPLDVEAVECVLDMQAAWCQVRKCQDDPRLLGEDRAIYEALKHFEYLDYQGLVIALDSQIEAFALGERLNPETAVIHIEKANPEVRGLYAAINQLSCQRIWPEYKYINREQDLGLAGLRQAKRSYQPHHMVQKFTILPG